jgi:hypothetical protein
MKPILLATALLAASILLPACTKTNEGDRRPSAFEEKVLGKWKLADSRYAGYWEFKPTVIDSLSTRTKTVRELEIHIPGFCGTKSYWSLTNDSVLDNSCIPMAKVIKLSNDSLIFRFSAGLVQFDYVWKR